MVTVQVTIELTPFKKVIGVEPGGKMLDATRKYLKERIGDSGALQLSAMA